MIGFIGTGAMGGALASAVAKTGAQIALSDASEARAAELAAAIGGQVSDNETLAKQADLLFLGVKPQTLPALLEQIGPALRERGGDCLVVSMAAGVPVARIQALCGAPALPVVRIMPNLAVSVGAGTVLYCAGAEVTARQQTAFADAMACAGSLHPLQERLIDPASAVTGCGPAFVALMIDALADGAVACGIPRRDALAFAENMTLGTAKLLLAQKKQPDQLKDEVCSPAGTTIQGVRALEARGFRGAVMEAVIAACEANEALKGSAGAARSDG